MIKKLTKFIRTERERLALEDNNRVGMAFSRLTRYYQFLLIIVQRYHDANEAFIANTRTMQSLSKPGTHSTTPEQLRLLQEGFALSTKLDLEIESFYLFAKILLDQVARVLEFYFGPLRSRSFDSHDDLVKNLAIYAREKGITTTGKFIQIAGALKKDISDHRDYEIAHEKSLRTMFSTLFDTEGKTKILSTRHYPTEHNKQAETKEPDKLLQDLDEYLAEFMEFIAANYG
jgi:hypothetical protein